MTLKKWLTGSGVRLRSSRAARLRAGKTRTRPVLERLEDRVVPVTIMWDNLNMPSTGGPGHAPLPPESSNTSDFAQAFGTNQTKAIQIVNEALTDWGKVITSFNGKNPDAVTVNGTETIHIQIFAAPAVVGHPGGSGSGGFGSNFGQPDGSSGAAVIFYYSSPNDFLLDSTQANSPNFPTADNTTSPISNFDQNGNPLPSTLVIHDGTFAAKPIASAAGGDLLTEALHEIGHAIRAFSGLSSQQLGQPLPAKDGTYNTQVYAYTIQTRNPVEPIPNGGPIVGAGQVPNLPAQDAGGNQIVPVSQINTYNVSANGTWHVAEVPQGPADLLVSDKDNDRYLISDLDALIIAQADGYSVKLPSQMGLTINGMVPTPMQQQPKPPTPKTIDHFNEPLDSHSQLPPGYAFPVYPVPSTAMFNGLYYRAGTASDDSHIYIDISKDGQDQHFNYAPRFDSTNTARGGSPALAVFHGKLYIAWAGTDGDGHLNVAVVVINGDNHYTVQGLALVAGRALSPDDSLANAFGPYTPTLAQVDDDLCIAWTGRDNNLINIAFAADGAHYQTTTFLDTAYLTPILLPVHDGSGPSGGDRLFVHWQGTDPNHTSDSAEAHFSLSATSTTQEGLTSAPANGVVTVQGGPGADDDIILARSPAGNLLVSLNGTTTDYDAATLSSVVVNTGGGAVYVLGSPPGVPVTINANGPAPEVVILGADGQGSTVTIHAANPHTVALTVDDSKDPTGRVATIDTGHVALAGANVFFGSSDLYALTVFTGTGVNTVNDLGTGSPLNVFGQGNGGGATDLTLDDSHDSANTTYTVTDSTVQAGGSAPISYIGIRSVTIDGGSGTDTFNVQGTAAGIPVTLNTGAGTNSVNVGDSRNTIEEFLGNLTVIGGGGSNTLNLNDQGELDPATQGQYYPYHNEDDYWYPAANGVPARIDFLHFRAGVIANPGAIPPYVTTSLYWQNFQQIVFTDPVGGSTVTHDFLPNALAGTHLTLHGGVVNDTLFSGTTAGQQQTFTVTGQYTGTVGNISFTGVVYLLSFGAGLATFKILPGGFEAAINGDGSPAVLDLSALTTPVTVNLPYFSAAGYNWGSVPGVVKLLASPTSIVGASGDTLVGGNAANVWSITGTNAGQVGGVTFSGFSNLTGGSQADTFKFVTGGSVTGAINGGGGVNTLDYSAYVGDIVVDLALGTATAVSGGIANIQNVTGSQGDDLIVGDANPNVLIGGTGRNIIIGGAGGDTITGGGGDNILIGGTTAYDTNLTALDAIFAKWSDPTLAIGQRTQALKKGIVVGGQTYALNKSTVFADNAPDSLIGGPGINWFFVDSDDTINNGAGPGSNDTITHV
jgi:hypothetical protein